MPMIQTRVAICFTLTMGISATGNITGIILHHLALLFKGQNVDRQLLSAPVYILHQYFDKDLHLQNLLTKCN
jgi:hypothetical protein